MSDRDNITLPREVVEKALRRAFHLGQNYWRDGDSDSRAANKRADKHFQDFDAMCSHVLARTHLAAEQPKPITVPKTVPLPPITCGFVDVRFDGERWFCDKCGKRMSADFEASVRRGSGEKCYLELMQRKSEAVRTMSERNMK